MKKKYEDYIMGNLRGGDLNSLSSWVASFCDEFNLKVKWQGLFETNATFYKTLKSLEAKKLIKYAYTSKVNHGWGGKGGNLVDYKITSEGWEYIEELRSKTTQEIKKTS